MCFKRALSLTLLCWCCSFSMAAQKAQIKEDVDDHFRKWLEHDVVYIISEEERAVFLKLTTDAERESFIEEFWLSRDPDPRTSSNEFRDEHYRRIQYAEEHFFTGTPGWKTDRGMLYIKFGPPDQIEAYPSGGHYNRPSWEGGGATSTYPFEIWRYRYLEGVGQDIEIEFVDATLSGEYRFARGPWDKDALLHAGGAGATLNEMLGLSSKVDRIAGRTNPTPGHNPLIGYGRLKDQPFEKLDLMTRLQRPPELGSSRLRELVQTEVHFGALRFEARTDYLRLGEDDYLVMVTVKLPNRELQYSGLGGIHRTVVQIYGELVDLTGRIVQSFEETVSNEIRQEELKAEFKKSSLYQKTLKVLPGRYKLQLAIKDEYGDKVGSLVHLMVVPRISSDHLATSSIVPALWIEGANGSSGGFATGQLNVFPNPGAEAVAGGQLPVFFEIYNLAVDQSTGSPQAQITYTIKGENGEAQNETEQVTDIQGSSLSLVKLVSLADLPAGSYSLRLQITDLLRDAHIERDMPFVIKNR